MRKTIRDLERELWIEAEKIGMNDIKEFKEYIFNMSQKIRIVEERKQRTEIIQSSKKELTPEQIELKKIKDFLKKQTAPVELSEIVKEFDEKDRYKLQDIMWKNKSLLKQDKDGKWFILRQGFINVRGYTTNGELHISEVKCFSNQILNISRIYGVSEKELMSSYLNEILNNHGWKDYVNVGSDLNNGQVWLALPKDNKILSKLKP